MIMNAKDLGLSHATNPHHPHVPSPTLTMPHQRTGNDPLERAIALALDDASIRYLTDYEGAETKNLDFYLPDFGVYLEIKGGHTERISDQMSRDHNVIAVQGVKSVAFVVELLAQLSRNP